MPRRDEVLEVIIDMKADPDAVGDGPSYRDLLAELRHRGYSMCLSTLRRHIDDLMRRERLKRNRAGRLVVINSTWLPPENSP